MTCEFLSGLTQLPFPSPSIVVGAGNITTAGTLYFFLSGRNRAGWTVASNPIAITYPANSSITITLPPAARGLGTDFLYYSIAANTTNDPIGAYQLAQWDNYQSDQYTRRTLSPIVLDRDEHIDPAGSVALPSNLPTGFDITNGMHRLIIGGIPNGATSSYYKYLEFESKLSNLEFILEPYPGEKWVRTTNPYTCQITDAYGVGGCAADVRSISSTYIIPPPTYDPIQINPVKGVPIKLTWHNDSTLPLKAGTNLGIDIRQGSENRTDAFNGKLIITCRGYTDGLGNYDRLDSGGVNAMPNVDIDRIWSYSDDALGILTLNKDLAPGESAVYEIAPYFTAQQFQGMLAPNELISTYIYPYAQSGKNVAPLWSIAGDTILPVAERMHPVPLFGAGIKVSGGSAIVKAYTFSERPDQSIFGLTPNTPNQKLCLDGNGNCAIRTTPLGSEAVLALISTTTGTSKVGALSPSIAIAASGKANLTLTIPNYAGNDECAIRSDYPIIGGDLGQFNPNYVRIFAKSGATIYPALRSGNAQTGVVPDYTQAITIDSLGAAIPQPANPTDPLFGLFDPPTITGTPATGGSIPAGSYQFFAVYYYDGSTVSVIDRISPTVIGESSLTLAELSALNQGWGRPIYNLSDLRSIARSDTFAWQHRAVAGGSIFYYDPDSVAADDGLNTFKPSYLTNIQLGRWQIRKSVSVNPAGIWNNTTTYKYLDKVTVTDDGSYLYINPTPSAGNLLTNVTYWQQTSFRGAQGIQGIPGTTGAITTGTNPNLPALNASANYTIDATANLAIGQYYAFSGISGTLKVTAIPTSTTITLENIDSVPASAVASGTKLVPTGEKGTKGDVGTPGTTGATTVGTNPNIPAINASATYTVVNTTGLAVGQLYGFGAIGGTLEVTALATATVTLKNIDSIAGVVIPASTKLNLAGRRGATGESGSPHVATGAYNAGTTYSQYQEVDYFGGSFYWRSSTPGNTTPPTTPTSNADWQLISARGQTGAVGIMGATTTGTNPNIPAVGASVTYTIDTTANLAVNQYYGFSGIAGSLLVTSIPTATTVVLQNTDTTVGASVATGIKLLAVGKTGNTGIQGIPGTTGATTVGTNPNIPVINASANYTIDSVTGLAIGQYYGFNNVTGTLILASVVSATIITLQNADATANSPIPSGTRLVPTGKKGDPGGGGDMFKSVYDTNNSSVVDNAERLNGQLPGFYLDRANHTGTQLANTISNFSESVDDRVDTLLVMGAGMSKVYDDTNNTLTLSSSGGGSGLSPWQLKTANYTAVAGDRIRVNATAGDIIITLPISPSATDADIWIQRLDLSANKVLLRTGTNKINSQSGMDGVFAPIVLQLIERVSYINNAIGWLGQYDRLTYQAYAGGGGATDPLFANVGLLLNLDTNFADSSSLGLTVTNTSTTISTGISQWGGGSAQFNGTASLLTLPTNAIFNRGTGDFCWELWINPDVGSSSIERNIFKIGGGSSAAGLSLNTSRRLSWWLDGTGNQIPGTPAQLVEGTWNYVALSRSGSTMTVWLNNAAYSTFSNSTSYNFSGWLLGSNVFNNRWKGFMDDIRFTNVARMITAAPTAAFPNS